jgi:hypothetical protein
MLMQELLNHRVGEKRIRVIRKALLHRAHTELNQIGRGGIIVGQIDLNHGTLIRWLLSRQLTLEGCIEHRQGGGWHQTSQCRRGDPPALKPQGRRKQTQPGDASFQHRFQPGVQGHTLRL